MIPKWILYVSGLKPPTGHRLDTSAVSASGCAWGFHGWFRQGTSRRCSIRRMMLCLFPETLIPMSIICYHFFMPYPVPYSAHIPNNIEKRTSKTTHFSGHFRCVTHLFSQAIYIPPGWWHSIRTHRPPPCHDGLPQIALSSPKKTGGRGAGAPRNGWQPLGLIASKKYQQNIGIYGIWAKKWMDHGWI